MAWEWQNLFFNLMLLQFGIFLIWVITFDMDVSDPAIVPLIPSVAIRIVPLTSLDLHSSNKLGRKLPGSLNFVK